MKTPNLKTIFKWKISLFLVMFSLNYLSYSQGSIPFEIQNTSTFNDSELYVAIVGKELGTGNHVWINPKTSQVLPMDGSYNTVVGPSIGGNTGPGGDSRYANCFTKLSEIPNKTFTLPLIQGCRVFISQGSQLYLYFHGSTGAPSGYAGVNPLNPTDPNTGILFEMIELTNDPGGFFGNPTRVDSYKYPIGLELYGANGYYQKVGEIMKHEEIVAAFKANVPTEFLGCVNDETGEITAPSKTPAFADGTDGRSVGPYANYLQGYIDAIWNKYKNQDLIFYAGQAGVFKGRVIGEQLEVVGQSGAFAGRTGRVQNRPSTQEALEGKGVLDRRLVDGDLDLVIQSQLTAAINRHMVDVTSANPGEQNWHNISGFYQANPMNHYSKFWHLPGISVDNLAYGFAYDDVADHSPSLHSPQPTKVVAVFGAYGNGNTNTGEATVYKDCNYGGYAVNLPIGNYTISQLQATGVLDDDISSLRVQNGYEVVLYADDNFSGTSIIVNADDTCLVDNSFNDITTSVRVRAVTNTSSVFIQAEDYTSMNGVETEVTTDTDGGLNVGYADTGDWMAYSGINFPTTGSYLIEYRIASAVDGAQISSDLNAGTIQLGAINIPNTGDWQNWQTISHTVNVNAGVYDFGIYIQNSGVNINWIRITKASNALAKSAVSQENINITIHPNPVENTLNFSSDMKGINVSVFNLQTGSSVSNKKVNNSSLDVSDLKSGVYTIVFEKDGKRTEKKFIKK
ncbi:putative secreted protein (Por secretion system target) [Tenacibaculum adriaticum]|uniref:Putative secreted protein (Por secretion system target) n=1 Tax=Tenacibaculum adriaticum TaxID=413713 RepID=A0A5S5DTM9_9FLAO|nr:beta-1,3-glucanase family protein [Tenacibaculum adriaticum]TYP99303.1 putative secreted protein (Por secretion system target) [Tenacibaculum adriaticum]